jgi:hypothetical protein
MALIAIVRLRELAASPAVGFTRTTGADDL